MLYKLHIFYSVIKFNNNKYKNNSRLIDNLKERIDKISNIIGENEFADEKEKNQFKKINDTVLHIKSKIINNSTMASDVLNKSKLNKG